MSETLGTLMDKLAVTNIKIALHENTRRDLELSDDKRLAASNACMSLNDQRTGLVTEIDEYLEAVLIDLKKHRVNRKHASWEG